MLVSVKVAAQAMGVSQNLMRQLIKENRIPAYKLSARTTRVDLDELKNEMRLMAQGQHSERLGVENG